MPGPLSREQFNNLRMYWAKNAPEGLTPDEFNDLVANEAIKAEAQPGYVLEKLAKRAEAIPGVSGMPAGIGLVVKALANQDELPSIGASFGGLAGGLAGGVGSIPGAALGGMAGEGVRRVLKGEPLDDITGYAKEGAIQGGVEGLTHGAGKYLLPAAGKAVYRVALRPSLALRKGFGDIAETGIREGVPVTQKGALDAAAMTSASRKDALALVDAADEAGGDGIQATEITGGLKDAFTKARNQAAVGGGDANALDKLKRRVQTIARTFGGQRGAAAVPPGPDRITRVARRRPRQPLAETGDEALTRAEHQLGAQAELAPSRIFQPTESEVRAARELGGSTAGTIPRRILNAPAPPEQEFIEFVSAGAPGKPAVKAIPGRMKLRRGQELKEEAQDLAANAYQAQGRGAKIETVDPVADLAVAGGFQKALESRVGGLKAQNKRTQELLGLLKALEDADAARLQGGPPSLTGLLNRIPTSPRAFSTLGITLDRTGKSPGGRNAVGNLARLLEQLTRQRTVNDLHDEPQP